MSVIVIDQIMGSFKTTFAIEYMKSRPLENFMYITPLPRRDQTHQISN